MIVPGSPTETLDYFGGVDMDKRGHPVSHQLIQFPHGFLPTLIRNFTHMHHGQVSLSTIQYTVQWLEHIGGKRLQIRPKNNMFNRKSTRLNSSHVKISYAVFCLKK